MNKYDVTIIGAGPAGISAGLYAKRAGQKTLILYYDISGLEKASKIENYYGFSEGITGRKLYEQGITQAKNIGIDVKNEEVLKIEMDEKGYKVTTKNEKYETETVILATGNKKNEPKITGIKELEGKGVSYCAVCDGFFYRNRSVSVLGNGDYAISETNELLPIVNDITILTNGEEPPEIRNESVKIETRKIKAITGEEKIEAIEFEEGSKLKTDGIFIAQGVAGSTEFAKKLGAITKNNQIITNDKMETNLPGLYACGDCTGGLLQISKAVYEGAVAGIQANKYIRTKKEGE